MKAIILAGGKGTRLLPLTETIPKALVPVGNSTLIETILDELPDVIDTVIITTKYLGDVLQEKIGTSYGNKKIYYAAQPADTEGTWEALYGAKDYIAEGENFCVLNCDDIFQKDEIARAVQHAHPAMGVTKTTMPAKYHGILINDDGIVEGFMRHTDMPREELIEGIFANGFFILDSRIFHFKPVALTDNEHGLPQTLLSHKDEYPLRAVHLTHWQPCNSLEDLEKLR